MRLLLYKLAIFLLKATESYVFAKHPELKDRIIIPNNLTGEIYICDLVKDTEYIYEVKDGIIVMQHFVDFKEGIDG